MIFGRKSKSVQAVADKETAAADLDETKTDADAEVDSDALTEESTDEVDAAEAPDADGDDAADGDAVETPDWRADGPFDVDEVELAGDEATRIDLGTLIVTPWDGLGLQLQVDEQSRQVRAVTGVWQDSGLEIALFAAPASGGLAAELLEDIVEEATQAGGTATISEGVFGPELQRVLPQEGAKGEQLFHVSRIWFAEGPRWLLRATLLGEAALGDPQDSKVTPFLEFFRNLVVKRGDRPMVPGEIIAMKLPEAVG